MELEHQQLDCFKIRTDWTLSSDFAIALEYRHRGSYWWRKVDRENFFLDAFHTEQQLKHSQLSDRRETLLAHFFFRFHPNWAFQVTSRQGWNSKKEPHYFEFEFDVFTTIQTAWNLRFSYQHQENDDRVAVYLNIGLKKNLCKKKNQKKFIALSNQFLIFQIKQLYETSIILFLHAAKLSIGYDALLKILVLGCL